MVLDVAEKATQLLDTTKSVTDNSSDNESIVILITGFVVVFMMLLLLIGIIKIYSGIVCAAQNKSSKKSQNADVKEVAPVSQPVASEPSADGLDLETGAVITAAVEAYYSKDKKVRITKIRPASDSNNEWASAGRAQNIPAMRWEGLL